MPVLGRGRSYKRVEILRNGGGAKFFFEEGGILPNYANLPKLTLPIR